MELFALTNDTITAIQWQAYPIGFVLLLLCLFTVLGNFLIIYAIICKSTLHTSTHYYIGSLAFSDLLVGLIVMPFAFIFEMTHDEYRLFSRHLTFLCDYWHSMDIFATTASIFGLCAIGFDRYIAITKPIEYPNSFLSKKWYYVLPMIWFCSAIVSFPPGIYFGTTQAISRQSTISNETTLAPPWLFKECDFPNNLYYVLFISIVSFYVPLIVMIYVYIRTYIAAREQVVALSSGYKHHHQTEMKSGKFSFKQTSYEENHQSSSELITIRIHHGKYQNPHMDLIYNEKQKSVYRIKRNHSEANTFWRKFSKNQKAAKFIGIIIGAFIICWVPYFVYFTLNGLFLIRLKDDQHHELLFDIFSWLGYTNSAADVLVYVSTSKELRNNFFRLFRRCRLRRAVRRTNQHFLSDREVISFKS
ncbi:unnamed protein product [Adineta ricciae]|uniref:G-protein coupled receptors family 1 profile domain-containing protein n=1 Tax=Adineta ricciae TaxID=249248 RepID=A0A814ES73_ADIRI|nr:unnamed protein product [Adineta ricciae]